ncbi:MAG: hypothetical protein AAGA83_16755 [Cyanobacteria bacterium P01_F01_bin.116]
MMFQSNKTLWHTSLSSVVAIAAIGISSINSAGFAQTNQSDVTGPNLSDVTGPNLSDVTGPNQSDNTGLLGEEIFSNADGDLVSLSDFFQDFFGVYDEELGLDPDANFADNLRQANRICNDEITGTRRFARTPPSSDSPSVSPACTEFSRLVQSASLSLDEYKRTYQDSGPVDQRLW